MLVIINSDVSLVAQCLIWPRSMPVSWRSPCSIGSQWPLAWRAAPSAWCAAWWSSPTSPTYHPSPSGTETVRRSDAQGHISIVIAFHLFWFSLFFYSLNLICILLIFYRSIYIQQLVVVFVCFGHSSLCLPSCLLTDKLLKPSKLAEMKVGGGAARLTLPHLAKDDEGLYTLRIFTKDGTAEHSAYLFVSGRIMKINKSSLHWFLRSANWVTFSWKSWNI